MKGVVFGGVVALLLASFLVSPLPPSLWGLLLSHSKPVILPPPPPAISTIQGMQTLLSTKVRISDSIEGRNDHFEGKWSLHGNILLGIDLAKVDYARIDKERMEATLRLPLPYVVEHKIDHEVSEELYLRAVSWFPTSSPQTLRAECWKMADRKLAELGKEQGYRERAKVQAERALQQLFQGVGWKVAFEWQDNPPPEPSQSSLVKTGN
jgi:hypothetical protein